MADQGPGPYGPRGPSRRIGPAPGESTLNAGNGAVAVLTGGKAGLGTTIPQAAPPIDVQGLRTMLVKFGYHIPEKGNSMGPLMKAALRDYLAPSAGHPVAQRLLDAVGVDKSHLLTSLRAPKSFNERYGLNVGGTVTAPTRPPVTRLDPNGNPTPADLVAQDSAPSPDAPVFDASGINGLRAIAGKIGTRLDPRLADQLAGLEFDPQIHDQGILAQRQTADAGQALHDIGHWYDQADTAHTTAAGRDHAISQAGIGSVRDAVSRIVASIGGSANQGSGMVGAAGADSVGTLAALGANEDQYNADLTPLLKAEAAGQTSRQIARNTSDAQNIAQKIVDLRGQRGQTKAKYGLDITDKNNALDQTRFQDSLALEQAKEAAALTGAKIVTAVAKANAPGKAPKGSFGASSSSDRTSFTKDVLSQLAPGGKLAKGMTRSKAKAIASRIATIYFPHGGIPNGSGVISSILGQIGL